MRFQHVPYSGRDATVFYTGFMVNVSNEHIPTPRIVDIIFAGRFRNLESIMMSAGNLLTIILILISEVSLPAMYFTSCPEIPFLDNFWLTGYRFRLRCPRL